LRGDDDDVATDDALCLGCPIWHAPAELARDSGSMLLGTSLLWGSQHGSNRNGDNDGSGGGTCNQRIWTSQHLLGVPLPGSPPFITNPKEFGGYNATDDAPCLGCHIQHAPTELTTDSGSMLLGKSLLQGSHHGSNRNWDNGSGNGGGGCNQRILMSQQLLCAPQPRSPPFISKPKELGGCIDGGHHSAAGPYSSGDNDDTDLVHPMITT
jgi:hypothetical protein